MNQNYKTQWQQSNPMWKTVDKYILNMLYRCIDAYGENLKKHMMVNYNSHINNMYVNIGTLFNWNLT